MKLNFLEQIKDRLFSNTAFIPVLGSLVLVLVLTVTLGLVSENQDNRQHAAGPVPTLTSTPLMSTQADTTAGTEMKCEDYQGAKCIAGDDWLKNRDLCTGAYTVNTGVMCTGTNGSPDPAKICCIKNGTDASNGTCESKGGSCQYPDTTACKSDNTGTCLTIDATCLDAGGNPTGNPCLAINTVTTPTTTPSVTPSSANCLIAKDGKEYCCPTGATRCGQTTDTICPLCVSAGQTCATGSQYSEAMCTAAFGSGSGCDPTSDQAAIDARCSTSTRGCTGGGQVFDKWACVANSSGSGGHCESQCKIDPSINP